MAGLKKSSSKKVISKKPRPKNSTPNATTLKRTRPKNSVSKVSVTKKDYLTNLPPELHLKIIPLLPAASFFDLAHTSAHLRAFMKLHAPTICNTAIELHFSQVSYKLISQRINGWLVPSHPIVARVEEEVRKEKIDLIKKYPHWGWKIPYLRMKLTEPGPQYLFFLEKEIHYMGEFFPFP